MDTSPTKASPTLLFIPDVSGFTRFVNETVIEHSQHGIKGVKQHVFNLAVIVDTPLETVLMSLLTCLGGLVGCQRL